MTPTHFKVRRWPDGDAVAICGTCGLISPREHTDRRLDLWRREHDNKHRQENPNGAR